MIFYCVYFLDQVDEFPMMDYFSIQKFQGIFGNENLLISLLFHHEIVWFLNEPIMDYFSLRTLRVSSGINLSDYISKSESLELRVAWRCVLVRCNSQRKRRSWGINPEEKLQSAGTWSRSWRGARSPEHEVVPAAASSPASFSAANAGGVQSGYLWIFNCSCCISPQFSTHPSRIALFCCF